MAVRDAELDELRLYVDYIFAGGVGNTMASLINDFDVLIGEYFDNVRPFVGDLDFFKASRAALDPQQFTGIPEPGSLVLTGLAAAGCVAYSLARRRRSARRRRVQ